jgi:putative permease
MVKIFNDWFNRNFSDPQVVILAVLLIIGFGTVFLIGDILVPLFAAVVIAYLLDGGVAFLNKKFRIPHIIAVMIIFSIFVLVLLAVLFILAPLMIQQASQFVLEIPKMMAQGQALLLHLPEKYPNLISEKHILELLYGIRTQVAELSQQVVSFSLSSVSDLLTFMVYLVMVPLLVFFFLKDRDRILAWFQGFLPANRALASQVWQDVNHKIAGYVRGKLAEILIVWFVSLVTFLWLDLNYAMLLAFIVGISVLIPYVGAAVVTLPIAIVAYFQWGIGSSFLYAIVAYGIIQFLDGNLLVPLLFSEMVNLHPAAIIAAVLVFGGLWGIWGVFFAIPLATLINAVINAWPATQGMEQA